MGFGDLKTKSGKQTLNNFLADKSYIEGFQPSQADVVVFEAVGGAPSADLAHALRWYNHILSYGSETSKFGGEIKPVSTYGPEAATNAESTSAAHGDDDDDDDDDGDLFGSDTEEQIEEYERLKQERLAAYQQKKAKKPAVVAKSSLVLDVKPWDDETGIVRDSDPLKQISVQVANFPSPSMVQDLFVNSHMAEVEKLVRSIEADGLLWGASKLVPLAFGIKKLQISAVIEDDKISTDFLEEEICKFEDFVQSMDVAAFNKV